jgi:hypothetical protein
METPPSKDVRSTGDDVESLLVKVHLLRQREDFDEARHLLETALARWPESQEVKDLLLQTEKDQLAASRQSGSEVDIGMFDEPWKAAVVGVLGVAGMGAALFMMGETIVLMARSGFAVPQAVSMRGTHEVYYVPAYSTLALPLLLFCFCLWLVVQAVKSFRE